MSLLAGDIGGTKTLLALYAAADDGTLRMLQEQRYDSQRYVTFEAVLEDFLRRIGDRRSGIRHACLAVAGPVTAEADGERAPVTNLPWRLDSRLLAERSGIPMVRLINDFQAVGYGIERIDPAELVVLQQGRPRAQAPRVVLGAGTGLGIAQLVWQGGHYRVLPSEGGHVDFAPNGALQIGLLGFLAERYGHVSIERLLSGMGLVNIYEYLCSQRPAEVVAELASALREPDPAPAIAAYGAAQPASLAGAALDLFVAIYGAHAGNLALLALPYGGVYVAGGIAPKIIERLRDGAFIEAFNDKGRMSRLTAEFPVCVVMNPNAGLIGAAQVAALAAGRPTVA